MFCCSCMSRMSKEEKEKTERSAIWNTPANMANPRMRQRKNIINTAHKLNFDQFRKKFLNNTCRIADFQNQ